MSYLMYFLYYLLFQQLSKISMIQCVFLIEFPSRRFQICVEEYLLSVAWEENAYRRSMEEDIDKTAFSGGYSCIEKMYPADGVGWAKAVQIARPCG